MSESIDTAALREKLKHKGEERDYWHEVATKAKDQRDAAIARAERAEAAIERVRAMHKPFTHPQYPGDVVYCKGCAVAERGEKSWPCETLAALDTGKVT